MTRPLLFALLPLIASLLPNAARAETDLSVLEGPVDVELVDGRAYNGRAVAFRDDVLYLRRELPDGEVERGFPSEQIQEIHFPGEEMEILALDMLDEGLLDEAVRVLEAVWRQRAPFLGLLNDRQLAVLYLLPELRLRTGNPGRAIGLAEELLARTGGPDGGLSLRAVTLRAHFALELFAESEALAGEWIEQQGRFPRSAIGWKILAELAIMNEDYDRAAWIALTPVSFAGPFETPFLADCYALGILALHELEEPDRAAVLGLEMHHLRLAWPEEDRFSDLRELYEQTDDEAAGSATRPGEGDFDLRPPDEDLNLPLRAVRKLVGGSD